MGESIQVSCFFNQDKGRESITILVVLIYTIERKIWNYVSLNLVMLYTNKGNP